MSALRHTSQPATGTPWPKHWPTKFPATTAGGWWARDFERAGTSMVADILGTRRDRRQAHYIRHHCDPGRAASSSVVRAILGPRPASRCVPYRCPLYRRARRRRADRGAHHLRPRRLRRGLRGTRCPIPRRRSGRSLAHVVCYRGGICRDQSARTSFHNTGFRGWRPSAGSSFCDW